MLLLWFRFETRTPRILPPIGRRGKCTFRSFRPRGASSCLSPLSAAVGRTIVRVQAIHDQIYLEVLRVRVRVGDDFGISPKPGIGERETGEGLGAPAQQPQNAVGGNRAAGGHEDRVVGFKTICAVRRAGERADEVLSAAGVAVEESAAGHGFRQAAESGRIRERQLSESEPPDVCGFRVG